VIFSIFKMSSVRRHVRFSKIVRPNFKVSLAFEGLMCHVRHHAIRKFYRNQSNGDRDIRI